MKNGKQKALGKGVKLRDLRKQENVDRLSSSGNQKLRPRRRIKPFVWSFLMLYHLCFNGTTKHNDDF